MTKKAVVNFVFHMPSLRDGDFVHDEGLSYAAGNICTGRVRGVYSMDEGYGRRGGGQESDGVL